MQLKTLQLQQEFEDAREVVAALSDEYAAAESSDYVSG